MWWLVMFGAVSLCMAMMMVEILWLRPKRLERHFAKQGIRGPPYKFFIGNVKEMVKLMLESSATSKPLMVDHNPHNILPRVLPFYTHWKKIYGSTFLLWFGPTARLTVADPDLIREIFVSRSQFFDRYESHPLVRQLEGDGLVSLHGKKWAHHRKILSPTFHMDNLKLLIPLVGKTVIDMVERWTAMSNDGIEIDVSECFQGVTEHAITQAAFGQSYDDGKAVFQLQARQMVFASEVFRKVLIPGYRFLPTEKNMITWKLGKEIKKNLTALIEHRKENTNKSDGCPKDLLGLMINAGTRNCPWEKSDQPSRSIGITIHDIVEECKTFFFAGKQTTSNLLTWTTVMLAMHTEWQEKARDEVLQVCGSRDVPTKDQLTKLKTADDRGRECYFESIKKVPTDKSHEIYASIGGQLGMIINETLRLYPPAVATIRRAKADVELSGYQIPCGTELLIPIIAVHHDKRLWGSDATRFNPTRFANGVARAAQNPTAFIPFGLGARMCIGQNLALLETKLTMAIILQRFSFSLSPSYIHAPTVLMLLYPKYGAPVIFRPLLGSESDIRKRVS